jgi:inorganic pyrophosphatase
VDEAFWERADALVAASAIVFDRPKGSRHPRYPEVVYPLDYGYLAGTGAIDGDGVDLWRGSLPETRVTGVIVTVDTLKRDAEVKLLIGCTADEMAMALAAHQRWASQGVLLVPRGA